LPALEGTTNSRVVGEHVAALYAARKAKAECSERIRRALKKQVRTTRDEQYTLGDGVHYKCPDNEEWKGPGKVIGQDSVVVFVRYGGQIVIVHVCRLKKIFEEQQETAQNCEKLKMMRNRISTHYRKMKVKLKRK
jgi:hypothetical protein